MIDNSHFYHFISSHKKHIHLVICKVNSTTTMLDFLLCFPLFFAFIHMMVVPPPSKRRRRGPSEQHQDVLAAGATKTDTELLDRPGGFLVKPIWMQPGLTVAMVPLLLGENAFSKPSPTGK